jgi:hypothetical protein
LKAEIEIIDKELASAVITKKKADELNCKKARFAQPLKLNKRRAR